jgi:hypothetical protein
VQQLAWRHLEGFGPASAADLAQFTLLTRSAARAALDAMAGRLERPEGPDGHVAGVWRPADGGIEATAFRELPERAWQGLAEEARALTSILAARDPAVYRRFAHWWKELPAAEVRLLPG